MERCIGAKIAVPVAAYRRVWEWRMHMQKREQDALIDLGDYHEIHAEDVGDYQELGGGRCRFVLYGWYKIDGLWRPKVTGLVTRSMLTMTEAQLAYWRGLFSGGAAAPSMELQALH